jgi:hypothetical protein
MQIVMLYFEDSLERIMRFAFESDGFAFTSTMDPDEALRALEASATPCVLLTDNYPVNPIISDALTRLRANPALAGKVWVIGLGAPVVNPLFFMDPGLVDEWFRTPWKPDDLFALFDRIRDSQP